MCRVLAYLGHHILLDELLYNPDSSLITQSYNPKLMTGVVQNLGGFGIAAWDKFSVEPQMPFMYRTHLLPFYDDNLKNMSSKLKANCIIAHVRGVDYSNKSVVSNQNVHPFLFDNTNILFAHNGDLMGFEDMRYDLTNHMKHEYKIRIKGTTDSELMYALFLSRLKPDNNKYSVEEIYAAIIDTIDIIRKVRKKHHNSVESHLNFFISDGDFIVAIRYVLDFGHDTWEAGSALSGYSSLWYTYGEEYGYFDDEYKMKGGTKKNSIIIASEPLTEDHTTWIEVPEYSCLSATPKDNGEIFIKSFNMESF